jgi:hypothetical protein
VVLLRSSRQIRRDIFLQSFPNLPLILIFCHFPFHNEIRNNFFLGGRGGNSLNSKIIFTLQKRTVRIIAGVKSKNSCRNIFMRLQILRLPWEYIFALMNFVVNNQEIFQIQQYTVFTLGTGTIFIDQLPTFHVIKKVHTVLASKSSTVCHQI